MSTGLGPDIVADSQVKERARIRQTGSYEVWVSSPPRPSSDNEEDPQMLTCRETSISASHTPHRHRHRHRSRTHHRREDPAGSRYRSNSSKHRRNGKNEHRALDNSDHEVLSLQDPSLVLPNDHDEEYGPMPAEHQLDQDYRDSVINEASTRKSRRVSAMDERRLHLKQQAEQRTQREAHVIAQFREMVDSMQASHRPAS